MQGPTSTAASQNPWEHIDRLRDAARLLLEAVALESGQQSELLSRCRSLWQDAEREAAVSLLYSDFENAASRLHQALRALAQPGVVKREGPDAEGA
jgi:hypothetical protein